MPRKLRLELRVLVAPTQLSFGSSYKYNLPLVHQHVYDMDLGASAFYFGPKIWYVHIFIMQLVPIISYMISCHALNEFCTWVRVIFSSLILVSFSFLYTC